jgi:hypothetical protein
MDLAAGRAERRERGDFGIDGLLAGYVNIIY